MAVKAAGQSWEVFVPRYSGLDPYLLGLVVVIGPVRSVEKPLRCR
jgi:hypothetical protein